MFLIKTWVGKFVYLYIYFLKVDINVGRLIVMTVSSENVYFAFGGVLIQTCQTRLVINITKAVRFQPCKIPKPLTDLCFRKVKMECQIHLNFYLDQREKNHCCFHGCPCTAKSMLYTKVICEKNIYKFEKNHQ